MNFAQTVDVLTRDYAAKLCPPGYTYTVEIVPGLANDAGDVWAMVDTDTAAKIARIMVRDLDKTPINADDPMLQLRITLAHEMGHIGVAEYESKGTVDAEERLVERWARALVAAQDEPVMVRAWARARVSSTVRARVANVAARMRADGGKMDPLDIVLAAAEAAMKAADPAAAIGDLISQIRSLMAGKAAGPPTTEMEPAMRDPAVAGPPDPMERKAREAAMEDEKKIRSRMREAAEEIDAIAKAARTTAKADLVTRARSALADHSGLAAVEKRIIAAPTYQEAAAVLELAMEMSPKTRARATGTDGEPVVAGPAGGDDALDLSGLNPLQVTHARQLYAKNKVAGRTFAAQCKELRARRAAAQGVTS